MLALIAAFVLSSPPGCKWWSRAEQLCRDSDVENLGEWDPRPPVGEWSSNAYVGEPPAWGVYPCEKQAENWSY